VTRALHDVGCGDRFEGMTLMIIDRMRTAPAYESAAA
jgi:hypothetical protein